MTNSQMDDATRLRLLEDALRDRDWMRVMDVVEDLGGNPDQRVPGSAAAREGRGKRTRTQRWVHE